ncbi:MAG: hypothetical protein R3F34_16985 [Planctomycetota bacterium]
MADEFFANWTNDPPRVAVAKSWSGALARFDVRGPLVVLWAFAPPIATLVEKLTMLPGEPVANPLLTGQAALFWLFSGVVLLVASLFGGPGRFARALAVFGWMTAGLLTSSALYEAHSDTYNAWLVARRFDAAPIGPDETYVEIVQGGPLYGTGAFVKALYVHDDGTGEIEWDGERLVVPARASDGKLRRYGHPWIWTCPAADGWWYVHHWDT